ncbi:MAG: phosphate--AMP phosphotransferase, partial [Candidatus Latescibacteria bacterium]|nr:phosphate--AMP phosphotransferase [Candidatus Latescibacterota bacterium]
RAANIRLFQTVIEALEARVRQFEDADPAANPSPPKLGKTPSGLLRRVDLSKSMKKSDYRKTLKKYQDRIKNLEHEVYRRRIPVVLVYEGWDAAGKGGNIKRLVQNMDPRGYEVIPISAPNDIEMDHHYLWRFWNRM